jgi:UPF0042 nucleotide-binding protein
MKLKIVSGRSGSGKSVALRVLEDLGYYCVDGLPVSLLPSLLKTVSHRYKEVAVSIDVRNLPANSAEMIRILDDLDAEHQPDLIFLDANDSELIRRFSETRRLHPLSRLEMSLSEAIDREKLILEPLSSRADLLIDSSKLSIHQLSEILRQRVLGKTDGELVLVFSSFGFKHGIPQDADYVFDARFLPNPHWEPELRPLTGQDEAVRQFLSSQPEVMKYIWQINNLLISWLPHLERSPRSYVTVAIGCTGGQHRSVFIAEQLASRFRQVEKKVQVHHRDCKLKINWGCMHALQPS